MKEEKEVFGGISCIIKSLDNVLVKISKTFEWLKTEINVYFSK